MNTYPPLSDYALIGDWHGGALVSQARTTRAETRQ